MLVAVSVPVVGRFTTVMVPARREVFVKRVNSTASAAAVVQLRRSHHLLSTAVFVFVFNFVFMAWIFWMVCFGLRRILHYKCCRIEKIVPLSPAPRRDDRSE